MPAAGCANGGNLCSTPVTLLRRYRFANAQVGEPAQATGSTLRFVICHWELAINSSPRSPCSQDEVKTDILEVSST
ncbi:hypothetical protein [Nostoc sp.]|uniref:hypothetical protein n=1 Tax=Nostoc sp. TaxID=1180 RepID=UPI002FF90DCD